MQRFKKIICVVTSDSSSAAALERAVVLAKNSQARLTVVRVIERIPSNIKIPNSILSLEKIQASIVTEHQKELKALIAPWHNHLDIEAKILIGTPYLEVIREVLRDKHDLVIKAAEINGRLQNLVGSNDMNLMRKCPCLVWLVKSDTPKSYRRILAAVDVDNNVTAEEIETRNLLTHEVIDLASSLALSEFAELHIAHAWEATGERDLRSGFAAISEKDIVAYTDKIKQQHSQSLNKVMDGIVSKLGKNSFEYLNPQSHLIKGLAHKEIPALADKIEADIVVMGTVARTGLSGFFMGNTAEMILNRIDCSILAVKPPGFITPVTLEE
ncbi:universal stress protein [Moritella sp. Urea-trap-13]|uniref:universal stress protein n=1 Tax=Moritella sp. Urea-trap-13 TaxID=2058327 RepID=UPI000C34D3B8|nr:universal stress protein [Moritella sp. Urea-trap-13]PKH07446.1 universal stress protein, UspA [Moritella sp. Urea-trap-13]